MASLARIECEGAYYHVMNRVNSRESIFYRIMGQVYTEPVRGEAPCGATGIFFVSLSYEPFVGPTSTLYPSALSTSERIYLVGQARQSKEDEHYCWLAYLNKVKWL